MSTLNAKVILNIKTSSEWNISTDILLDGEVGIESDTRLIKIGNGVSVWNALPYACIHDIADLDGVTVTNPVDGQVFTYSGGLWVNANIPALPADTDLSHYDNTTSGFITTNDIPSLPADTDLSHYDNTTSDFATVSQIPTDVSQLNNDAGYITSATIPTVNDATITIQQNGSNVASFTTNQASNEIVNITIPTNISAFNNDVGYLTSASLPSVNDGTLTIQQNSNAIGTFSANSAANSTINVLVPTKTSDLTNDAGFITTPVNNGTLTIKQEGNTIATFSANSAVNVVANITGGGGGGGGGASYTSQLTVDSGLIPDTDAVYQLGDSTHRWTYLYSEYLSTGDGSDTTVEQSIIPSIDSNFNLGSASYAWDNVYTDNIVLNGTSYNSIPTDTSDLTNNAGFITSAALPTVNDATLTIQKNSSNVGTFTANASSNVTIDISVPTDTGDLTNNAGFITSSDIPALPSNTDLSDYDNSNSGFITSSSLPTVNDATLTIQKNGTTIDTFTANSSTNTTVNITVPTDTGDLTNNAGFITGVNALNDIGDVVITSPQDGEVLKYDANSGEWINSAGGGSYLPLTGGQMTGDITVSGNLNLGDSTQSWNTVYTDTVKANSNTLRVGGNNSSIFYFVPTVTSAINILGSSTDSWEEAYIDLLRAGSSYTYISADSHLWPTGDATKNLGEPNHRWKYLYVDTILGGSTGTVNSVTLLPETSSESLGTVAKPWGDIYLQDSGNSKIYFGQVTDSYIQDVTANTLLIHATGQVVSDSPNFRPKGNSSDLGQQYHRWSTIWYTTLNPPSDIRLKDNVEPLESGLKIVNDLDIKSFTFKNSPDHIEYGIIAQDVVEKYPELISVPDSEEGTYGTYLHNFIFASLRAIQELSSKVDELNAKIEVLESKL